MICKNCDHYNVCLVHCSESVLRNRGVCEHFKHGWISVKERLPEESDGTVLVCFPDVSPYNLKEPFTNAKHGRRIETAHYSQFSKTWYIGDMCGVGGEDPIYWKPLPEPPKEEFE